MRKLFAFLSLFIAYCLFSSPALAYNEADYDPLEVSIASRSIAWKGSTTFSIKYIPAISADLRVKIRDSKGNELGDIKIDKNGNSCSVKNEGEDGYARDRGIEMLAPDGTYVCAGTSSDGYIFNGTIFTTGLEPSIKDETYTLELSEHGQDDVLTEKTQTFKVLAKATLAPNLQIAPEIITLSDSATVDVTVSGIDLSKTPSLTISLSGVGSSGQPVYLYFTSSGAGCGADTSLSIFAQPPTCTDTGSGLFTFKAKLLVKNFPDLRSSQGIQDGIGRAVYNINYSKNINTGDFIPKELVVKGEKEVDSSSFSITVSPETSVPGGEIAVTVKASGTTPFNKSLTYMYYINTSLSANKSPVSQDCGDMGIGAQTCREVKLTVPQTQDLTAEVRVCQADDPTNCDAEEISLIPFANAPPKPAINPPPCKKTIEGDGCQEVFSAFGNFKTDPQGFLTKLFSILLSISGGIALLFIIRSGYQLMTSQGDPEKVKEARERITSAIVGLLFIVFSLVILEVIGVDILAIPGLNK